MKKETFDSRQLLPEVKLIMAGWCREFSLRRTTMDVEHSHQFWQIDLCEKGTALLKVGDRRYNCQPGDIVIISPDLTHRFVYPAGQEFLCWSFKFECPLPVSPQVVPVCDDEERSERMIIIESLARMCQRMFPPQLVNKHRNFAISGDNIAAGVIESLIRGMVKRWFLERKNTGDTENLSDAVSEYVYRRGGIPVSVKELAGYLGYSAGHLRVLIRQTAGMSTKNLIDRARINVAKRMLLYSDARISELSELMGFADEKYFSKFFRKYTGMPPREYVKRKRSATDSTNVSA